MSLRADYLKERRGLDSIETELGFVDFFIGPPECHIEDMYVRPAYRGQGKGTELLNLVRKRAEAAGCNYLTSQVILGTGGAEGSLAAQLKRGFKLHSANNNVIMLYMEINPKEGSK